MSEATLEAHELSKRYSRRGPWALHDVSLSLRGGGVVGLVGPNGAGKSTLLRTWMGFERPTRGSVLVLGSDPWLQGPRVIPRLAYLPQHLALYRDLTVADHLAFAVHYRGPGFDHQRARGRLADLAIDPAAKAGELSGGQASQVALAIAIGLHAEVMLLDEPLASLDPLARREFLEVLLDDVASSGSTVVLSSHLVSDIEHSCNRLIVLGLGRVMLEDSIEHVRSSHRVVPGREEGLDVVSRLPGEGGTLVRANGRACTADERSATLEEVVIGYLAAARP
jgi:ABC-2 type transport system ATP-binding protein